MQKIMLSLALSVICVSALAEVHEVKMLNNGKDGTMVFEPGYLKVAKGDQVKFIKADASHNSESLFVPPGAKAWKGKMDEEITVKLDQEGVYLYVCEPHKIMAMAGVIQVGKAANVNKVKVEADTLSKTFVMNKDRLAKLMEQVK